MIMNCTITSNTAKLSYFGGAYYRFSNVAMKNTIIYGNTPDTSEMSGTYGNIVSVSHSDIAGYSGTGDGNLDEAPLFVGSGDYRLSAGSLCIDTGTSSGAPDTDIVGTRDLKARATIWGL